MPITSHFDPHKVNYVSTKDTKKKLGQYHREHKNEEIEKLDQEYRIYEQIQDEIEDEQDPDSLQYYIRQWYGLIHCVDKKKQLTKELESIETKIESTVKNIRTVNQKIPDHEANWLPYLEKVLPERNEGGLLETLKNGYEKLKKMVDTSA